jgi:hypothetical protein
MVTYNTPQLPNDISTASGPHCLAIGTTWWGHYVAIFGATVLTAVMMHPQTEKNQSGVVALIPVESKPDTNSERFCKISHHKTSYNESNINYRKWILLAVNFYIQILLLNN